MPLFLLILKPHDYDIEKQTAASHNIREKAHPGRAE
jgi:hypothetical protein